MRFDWYSATLKASPEVVIRRFQRSLDLSEVAPAPAKNGFHHGATVSLGSKCVWFFWGGPNVGGMLQVQGTGESGGWAAQVMREHFPDHRVTRADVAQDYDDPTAWDFWFDYVQRMAKSYSLKYQLVQSGLKGEGGRTVYIGSEKSVVRLRVYEKGKKEGGSPGWVRVELMVRPKQTDIRERLASAPYRDFFGCSRWSRDLGATMGMDDLPNLRAGSVYSLSPLEKRIQSLLRQYGNTITELLSDLGGDTSLLGLYLARGLESPAAARIEDPSPMGG